MDKAHYEEMKKNLIILLKNHSIQGKDIYLFGHCNASEELIDLFFKNDIKVKAILDNNISKYGFVYREVPVVSPCEIMNEKEGATAVCIVARAYSAMERQLRQMGYMGAIWKLTEYDSYGEYSLSQATIIKRQERVKRGICIIKQQKKKYSNCYRIYCPFSALGDVYYMMAYLPYFLERKGIIEYVIFVIGNGCAEVVRMFGAKQVETLSQKDMDEVIQAVLFTNDENAYIPHHDRPYVAKLGKVLYLKKMTLEMLYKRGVFGLEESCIPYKPMSLKKYKHLEQISLKRGVILSPYAKSVTAIPQQFWKQIVNYYKEKDFQIFTNAVGEEQVLEGTLRLDADLTEMQSIVEKAGIFIGIRSGLCDVLKDASCRKIALYPDCYYSDTRWKMEEIYHLDSFENIVIR